ncbi:MAG: hypothetical protein P4L50_01350 [Anaerolineaceae bacterium]|nr:hypothetical protein [Anaerolineaceae bacterium]
MDQKTLDSVCKQVYQKFPEAKGVKPKVKAYSETQSLLLFQTTAQTADGRSLPRTIRVVVDESGKISKMSTSH